MDSIRPTTLFLDIGGVILTNGWGRALREQTANQFKLDYSELNNRHAITFDTYEIGKISFDEYLRRIVFYVERPFSIEEIKEYIFTQAHALPEMIELIKEIKHDYSLSVVAVSNEGRELMEDRVKRFSLKEVIDFFVCSSFVGLRKPDYDIYRLALDFSQAKPEEVIYLDDREILVDIGCKMGLRGIHHKTADETRKRLNELF
jgi:putative hydrolase of the HAD superfamily